MACYIVGMFFYSFVDVFIKFSFHGTINIISFKMYRIEYHLDVDRQGTSPGYDYGSSIPTISFHMYDSQSKKNNILVFSISYINVRHL